jgi:hypothetical protein
MYRNSLYILVFVVYFIYIVVDPGCLSRILIFPSRIRIRIKEFMHFLTQKRFLSFRKNYLGCSFWIPVRIQIFSTQDPDPGSRGQKGTGCTGSQIRNTVYI